jgi:hypothetical protein
MGFYGKTLQWKRKTAEWVSLDDGGYPGHNFTGTMPRALGCDEALSSEAVDAFARGQIPDGRVVVESMN